MTDLHTHILPGVDDGAPDPAVSLDMLRLEAEQGVDTVVLTPHFYRNKERIERFLTRRQAAFERLSEYLDAHADRAELPKLELGAEVAWMPNMYEWDELDALGVGESNYFLLELPFYRWSNRMFDEVYDLLSRSKRTPLLAHLERYEKHQRKDLLKELYNMDVPIQLSAEELLHPLRRRHILKLLQDEQYFLASDCHNLSDRKPNLGPAADRLKRSMGAEEAERILDRGRRLLQTK